jgi:DNA-binding transcriptional regulator YhcF (GntR family)
MVPPARSFINGTTGATPSRTEAVLDAIKRAILAGELRPGQSLVETELAQLLGVSKTPVREALKTLAGAGLVTMSAYRGATVRAIDPASAAAIYDLRLLLEPEAVRRAVGRGARRGGKPGQALGGTQPGPRAPAPTRRWQRGPRVAARPLTARPAACWSGPDDLIRPRWCPLSQGRRGSRRRLSIRPSGAARRAVRLSARARRFRGRAPIPAPRCGARNQWSTDEH